MNMNWEYDVVRGNYITVDSDLVKELIDHFQMEGLEVEVK